MAVSQIFQSRFIDITDEMPEKNKTKRAQIIGISNTTYFNAYNYGIMPKAASLIRIADYFNLSVEYLIGTTDKENFAKSETPSDFQTRLTHLREQKGIATVYELAKLTHIHRANIAQWLHKDYLPVVDDLILLADFFNVSVDYLLGRTDDRAPYGD